LNSVRGEAAMNEHDRTIVKGATEARQAVTGHNVRYVLIISLVAIIILFAGVWLYFFG
jgi:hypothetical protein